jgi:succinate dehydrogenase hydrophobic anchor subunit
MLRTTTNAILRQSPKITHRCKSAATTNSNNSSGPLQGDAGNIATHIHHKITTFLAIATPLYFMGPDSIISGPVDKGMGLLLAVNVSAHSWIGLNYVVTDYVPKVSKAMVGPARLFSAGIGLLTLVGLGKIAFNEQGGLRATTLGLWKGENKKDDDKKE